MEFSRVLFWLTEISVYEDFIFRAPIQVSKPGELREEYENQLWKLKEQTQEEMASEELDSSYEEMEDGKRKQEDRLKGEPKAVKVSQSKFCDHPDDSENEEPFRGRTVHRSAFVSKCSNYSLASLSGHANSREERSRSCSDAVKEGSKSRRKALHRRKAKISKVANVSVAGILSSTENNRSFSAPDLTDKRLSGSFSYPLLQKSERSISPESNDSISEELNHFKPIVCSPCTPPKKLPNGKVLRPVIIKSTPRNLRRSLQSPTCYKASPRILMKWNAIFQDRRAKTTLSQGTITVIGDAITASDQRPAVSTHAALITKELSKNVPPNIKVSPLPNNDCSEPATFKDHAFLLPDAVSHKHSKSKQSCSQTDINANTEPDCKPVCRKCPLSNRLIAESQTQTVSLAKTKGKRLHRHQNNNPRINLQNGTCCVQTEGTPPSQRRGQKRHCKTKHLDVKSCSKRLKTTKQSDLLVEDPLWKERQEKHWQEEEDRKLASRLQRLLNNESNTIDRRKGSRGEYLLRSNRTAHTST